MMILLGLTISPDLPFPEIRETSIIDSGISGPGLAEIRFQKPGLYFMDGTGADISDIAPAYSGTKEAILELALEFLVRNHDSEMYRFTVEPRWVPGSILRLEPHQIKSVVQTGGVERFTNFEVTFTEGSRHRTSQIQLMVETERKLPVAGRRIMNGEVIHLSDVDMRWISVPYDRGQLVDDPVLLEGKTLRRTLSPGQPVRHADVSSELLVEAGDTVVLIFEQYGVLIELSGEARQSGAQDDEIRIYSSETRKRYLGRVTGPGKVIWKNTL